MPTSLIESHSLIAIDIGSVTTRAVYFDVVEEQYRFIGMGQSPTTVGAPYNDVGIGVRQAISNLQSLIGHTFLDDDQRLIMPSVVEEGSGIDMIVATVSAGAPMKTVIVGLLDDVSVSSVQHLMRGTYSRIVDTIGLNDRRKQNEQIEAINRHAPDVIVIAGGTEGGATRSIQKLLETIGLYCYVSPESKRPAVLYAGNSALADDVKKSLRGISPSVQVSPNIRPSLDVEDTDPAQRTLATILSDLRRRQINGMDELSGWSGGAFLPTAYAYGRMIRFLGHLISEESDRGIIGLDLGASSVTVSSSFGGSTNTNVFPQFGLGEPLAHLLRHTTLEEIMNWLPIDVPSNMIRDYLFQKSLYPNTVPATPEDLAIEEALARQILQLSISASMKNFPRKNISRSGLLSSIEMVMASGAVLTNAPTHGQSLLMLLDALQPVGVTRFVLDKNNLLPALGVAAERNTILPVHVIESWAFTTLSTVISPVSNAKYGAPILRARIIYQDGNEGKVEIKQGGVEVLPLTQGQLVKLELQPLGRTNIGAGFGKAQKLEVGGGALGVVVDARGRSLQLPSDPVRRRELIKKWQWTLGG